MHRTVLAVPLLAVTLAACGAHPHHAASSSTPRAETLLVRAGDSVLAVNARTGRSLRRVALGAHDATFETVYSTAAGARGDTTAVMATEPATGRRRRLAGLQGRWRI